MGGSSLATRRTIIGAYPLLGARVAEADRAQRAATHSMRGASTVDGSASSRVDTQANVSRTHARATVETGTFVAKDGLESVSLY